MSDENPGLWTNGAFYALSPTGQLVPVDGAAATAHHIALAKDYAAAMLARTINGRDLIEGRVTDEEIRLKTWSTEDYGESSLLTQGKLDIAQTEKEMRGRIAVPRRPTT
jgi:hypothetical protein